MHHLFIVNGCTRGRVFCASDVRVVCVLSTVFVVLVIDFECNVNANITENVFNLKT